MTAEASSRCSCSRRGLRARATGRQRRRTSAAGTRPPRVRCRHRSSRRTGTTTAYHLQQQQACARGVCGWLGGCMSACVGRAQRHAHATVPLHPCTSPPTGHAGRACVGCAASPVALVLGYRKSPAPMPPSPLPSGSSLSSPACSAGSRPMPAAICANICATSSLWTHAAMQQSSAHGEGACAQPHTRMRAWVPHTHGSMGVHGACTQPKRPPCARHARPHPTGSSLVGTSSEARTYKSVSDNRPLKRLRSATCATTPNACTRPTQRTAWNVYACRVQCDARPRLGLYHPAHAHAEAVLNHRTVTPYFTAMPASVSILPTCGHAHAVSDGDTHAPRSDRDSPQRSPPPTRAPPPCAAGSRPLGAPQRTVPWR